jgi:hypothetical protein
MHQQPVFMHCPSILSGVSERLFGSGLCLPSGSSLSDEDLNRIAECVYDTIKRAKRY